MLREKRQHNELYEAKCAMCDGWGMHLRHGKHLCCDDNRYWTKKCTYNRMKLYNCTKIKTKGRDKMDGFENGFEKGFEKVQPEKVKEERNCLSRLRVFAKRYINKTVDADQNSRCVLCLFSGKGILLDIFAKERGIIDELAQAGIVDGTDWTNAGHNAVTDGLKKWDSMASAGEENQMPQLKDFAVYFAPIRMLSPYEPYDPEEECGLAFIVPLRYAWDEYLMMVRGMAHDMMITLQFNNIATMYYERSGKGLLSIDNMMNGEQGYIATYYNDELFRILGVKPMDIYYKPVESLIDPPPYNKELWNMVNNHETVENYPLSVHCGGKEIKCIVSTDAYNQPSIDAHGITLYFTTQQKMTGVLSSQVANGAIKTFDDIIGEHEDLRKIKERAMRMATTNSNIMILGESGTGKDVFAQAIHNASSRRNKPFIALNCGAMPRDLIESELFGYETGAFTGAKRNGNMGKFELAMGGTIFLDEIGEMPLDLQAKLLRVVEQKQLMRLGGSKLIDVDVKIISATNVNIWKMIDQKMFRSDLFYRLSTMTLNLMPLRERKEDIVLLAEYFIRSNSGKIGKSNIMRLTPKAKEILTSLPWNGNVRELQNLIECIVQLYPGDMILPEYITDNVYHYSPATAAPAKEIEETGSGEVLLKTKESVTKEEIIKALAVCKNNRTEAARMLGISRRTFYRKLKQMEIED